jgi:hypothetical protein
VQEYEDFVESVLMLDSVFHSVPKVHLAFLPVIFNCSY